ncbi:MAG: NAD(P)-dependent alcohol dehydrogenase, partial [Nonomuraea sp.]|nr:NAD(P)-dependent alcohol dehydrogenase [Nonomuraea sp.]
MKAIVQDKYGTADVLRQAEIAQPQPAEGQVLVRVLATGVDRGVVHLMTGLPYLVRLGFGLTRPRIAVRGQDLAGIVEAVGPGVTGFKPGDEVCGSGTGTFAEYAIARQDRLVAKPARLSFAEAAALPVSGVTALDGVGTLHEGQRVLVTGAGGGVGSFVLQIAAAQGAEVTAVCGPGKAEFVRSLGATHVVDYTRQDVTGRYDLVVDLAGNRPLRVARGITEPAGRLVILGGENGGRLTGGFQRQIGLHLVAPFVRQKLTAPLALVRQEPLRRLVKLVEDGTVTPAVTRTYPLAEAAEAVRHVEAGHA